MALEGHVALVIGGASGIGLATALQLLREGANVAVGDVSTSAGEHVVAQMKREFGDRSALFLAVDVCNDVEMEAAFVNTKKHFTKLNILVNSAGIFNDNQWNLEVNVNMNGVIRGSLLAWKHMGKHNGGSGGTVVNIASIFGLSPFHSAPIYVATKYAIVGLGRSLGMQPNLDRTGVRFVTMCPGFTETPFAGPKPFLRNLSQDLVDEHFKAVATFPKQKPDDVARAILHVIQHAGSGSVWVSENGQPAYEVAYSHYTDLRTNDASPFGDVMSSPHLLSLRSSSQ